jgi:F420-nonreducing hydrogenase I cytochrome b subunit
MTEKTTRVQRHSAFFRVLHWAIFFEGVFMVLTGMQRGGMLPFGLTMYPSNTFSYHIAVGILFIACAILVGYEMIISGDYSWVSVRRIPLSFRYIANETRAWFGLWPPMKESISYNPATKSYKEKLIPSAIVVWWAFVILGWILVPTGLALAFPTQFAFIYSIVDPIGIALTGVGGYAFMVAVHRLATVFLVLLVFMHIYSTFIYRLVQSIILGYRREPVAQI